MSPCAAGPVEGSTRGRGSCGGVGLRFQISRVRVRWGLRPLRLTPGAGSGVRGTDGVWGRLQGLDAFPFVSTFIDGDSIRARVYATNRGAAEPPHVLHAHTSTK